MPAIVFRCALLAVLIAAVAAALRAPARSLACRTELGACAQTGAPRCGLQLGAWRVVRSREAGLAPGASHSACVRHAPDPRDGSGSELPLVSLVPQEVGVSGDTLMSAPAGSADAQRAVVTLHVAGSLPDHWAFAVAGTFLERDTPHRCSGLVVQPPVNAGHALIGGNWQHRPHGFYFERLADACVYDGQSAACAGEPSWIAHEFAAGETFALDLTLRREGDAWWLTAAVASVEPGPRRALGRMRQRVGAPCWLEPGDPGSALLVVIPEQATAVPETSVDVSGFAWAQADGAPR